MAVSKIDIAEFLNLAEVYPVLDVRSPSEYHHAHIPGAVNLPLFSDEERAIVGTTYKQNSREAAIKKGLDFFGPKMRRMVEEVESLVASRNEGTTEKKDSIPAPRPANIVLVHCWRGGMRSAGVAWLLDLYGFKVYSLAGGYKMYRQYVHQTFAIPCDFIIVGGYTGSGKTFVLKELEKRGENIIDLEGIACHKGSAFGAIGQPRQPSQEMFENILSAGLRKKIAVQTSSPIWIEDESQRIGLVNLPPAFWERMRESPVYFLEVPFEERLQYIVHWYGGLDTERMVDAIQRIRKRLGGLDAKLATAYLLENNVEEGFRILLKYYDKYYLKGLNNRNNIELLIKTISCDKVDAPKNAEKILQHHKSLVNVNDITHG